MLHTEPTANLTGRGYTGHQSNNLGSGPTDLGLIYMNARYYLPTVGKFASPDTIVPDPANPQSHNRYSYVLNSPLTFSDPTGHIACEALGTEECSDGNYVDTPPQANLGTPLAGMYDSGRDFIEDDHSGQDVISDYTTELLAVATGHVRVADNCTVCNNYYDDTKDSNWGTGNVVIIEYAYEVIPQHIRDTLGLEPGMSLYVQYQHMANINDGIEAGVQVELGDLVGAFGDTGKSSGLHLHVETKIGFAGALGSGFTDGAYDTYETTWDDLTLVDPRLIWYIPDISPYIAPNTPPHPSSHHYE